jgi:hypothetical protein
MTERMSGAVPAGYRHIAKVATPGDVLQAVGAVVKWYDVAPHDLPVPKEVGIAARAFVEAWFAQNAGADDDDAGFVILHRCGADFYFLLLQLWRGANECWEAVFAKQGGALFAAFDAAYPGTGALRPTFCVWELGVVAHEAQAWSRYLLSPRSAVACEDWLNDRFDGEV